MLKDFSHKSGIFILSLIYIFARFNIVKLFSILINTHEEEFIMYIIVCVALSSQYGTKLVFNNQPKKILTFLKQLVSKIAEAINQIYNFAVIQEVIELLQRKFCWINLEGLFPHSLLLLNMVTRSILTGTDVIFAWHNI